MREERAEEERICGKTGLMADCYTYNEVNFSCRSNEARTIQSIANRFYKVTDGYEFMSSIYAGVIDR